MLHFKGKDRGLVLNKTNGTTLAEILGTDETDNWTGRSVVLFPSKTDFQGKRVDCIRIKADPRQPAPPEPEPELDDEVPF